MERTMSEQNKTVVRRYFEAVNTQDISVYDEIVDPQVIFHGMQVAGVEQLKGKAREIQDAFPDMLLTVEHLVAEGDKVAGLVSARATHTGEFEGIPATGRAIKDVTEADVFRLQDGKIVEVWHLYDAFGMLTQLGLLPAGEEAVQ
jgi:C-1 hydroxylase